MLWNPIKKMLAEKREQVKTESQIEVAMLKPTIFDN